MILRQVVEREWDEFGLRPWVGGGGGGRRNNTDGNENDLFASPIHLQERKKSANNSKHPLFTVITKMKKKKQVSLLSLILNVFQYFF